MLGVKLLNLIDIKVVPFIKESEHILDISLDIPGKHILQVLARFVHWMCIEYVPFLARNLQILQELCWNITFLAQFLASSKNLVRNLQGARILHGKCPFSCSVSRILQDIFPEMCILLLDTTTVDCLQRIHHIFVFLHSVLMHFASEWSPCSYTFINVLASNDAVKLISTSSGTCNSTLDR